MALALGGSGSLASRRIAIVVRERVAASGPTSEHRKALIDKIGDIDNIGDMSRLTIEIEPEQHRQIKTLATFAGMTIKEFILSKTLAPSAQESQGSGDTTSRLLGSARNAQRLRDAVASKTPEHLVFETTEDLKRALGI